MSKIILVLIIFLLSLNCTRIIPAKYESGDIVCMKIDGRKVIVSLIHNRVDAWEDDNTLQFWYAVKYAKDKKNITNQISIGGSAGIGRGGDGIINDSDYKTEYVHEGELCDCEVIK